MGGAWKGAGDRRGRGQGTGVEGGTPVRWVEVEGLRVWVSGFGGFGCRVGGCGVGRRGVEFGVSVLRVYGLGFEHGPCCATSSPPCWLAEATQGQMDGFFSQLSYTCQLEEVASVGGSPKSCPQLDSRVAAGSRRKAGPTRD